MRRLFGLALGSGFSMVVRLLSTSSTATPSVTPLLKGLNLVTVVGVVHEIQIGYIYENAVLQFALSCCSFPDTPIAQQRSVPSLRRKSIDADKQAMLASLPTPRTDNTVFSDVESVKENFVVRIFGAELSTSTRQALSEGYVVEVSGQFKMNPQVVDSSGRSFHFPFIQVSESGGAVRVLSGSKRKALIDTLHKTAESAVNESASKPHSSVISPANKETAGQ